MDENEYFETNVFHLLDPKTIGYLHAKFRIEAGLIREEFKNTLVSDPIHPLQMDILSGLGLTDKHGAITPLGRYIIGKIYTGSTTHYFRTTNYNVDMKDIGRRIKGEKDGVGTN